ncbi:hypothetical protein PG988_001126 [Apiospora saccharicola]
MDHTSGDEFRKPSKRPLALLSDFDEFRQRKMLFVYKKWLSLRVEEWLDTIPCLSGTSQEKGQEKGQETNPDEGRAEKPATPPSTQYEPSRSDISEPASGRYTCDTNTLELELVEKDNYRRRHLSGNYIKYPETGSGPPVPASVTDACDFVLRFRDEPESIREQVLEDMQIDLLKGYQQFHGVYLDDLKDWFETYAFPESGDGLNFVT